METLLAQLQQPGQSDLAIISDGWLPQLHDALAPFEAPALFSGLLPAALHPAVLGVEYSPRSDSSGTAAPQQPLSFPWAFGSWVMVFRHRPDWASRAGSEGWSLLAAAELNGHWLLPASPRVVMALVLQSLQASANHPDPVVVAGLAERLAIVVRQAKGFDSQHAMTRIASGKASAAVVPSWAVIPQLLHDHRLRVVRPEVSPPLLCWRLLVRPRKAAPAPQRWLQAARQGRLLEQLLRAGYCPPLPEQELQPQLARQPAADLLHPGRERLATAETLAPFSIAQQSRYQDLWNTAMRERAAA